MPVVGFQVDRIGHVSLRVRSLERSVEFYRRLFGLQPHQAEPPSEIVRICTSSYDSRPPNVAVVLTEGLPSGAELTGLDHFSFVVATPEDVDEAYHQAVLKGARVTQPRLYAGHYQTFVFDPDGYKIEIRTMEPMAGSMEATG